MEFTIERKKKSQAEITITTTQEETDAYVQSAVKRLAKKIKLPGFRAGKVPEDVVRAKIGDAEIYSEALDHALPKLYAEVVMKEQLQPVSRPSAEIVQDAPIKVKLTVDLFPEVTVGDYAKISVTCKPEKVTEKDLHAALDRLREAFSEFVEVTHAAKLHNRVEVDFEGFDTEGKPIAGAKSSRHPIILGSNVFVPGFEDALVGVKQGETREFSVTFPKEYHATELAHAKVKFVVTVHKVEEQKKPELDDAFAQKVSAHRIKTIDDLKKEIEAGIAEKALSTAREQCETEVIDKLIAMTKADLPPSMLAEEMEYMLADLNNRLTEQGMTLERFIESEKTTLEKFRESMEKPALRRVMMRIALNEIATREKIEPTEAEISNLAKESDGKDRARVEQTVRVHLRLQKTLKKVFDATIHMPEGKESHGHHTKHTKH